MNECIRSKNMTADSNMSFHQGIFPSSFYNQNVVSLQSEGMNSSMGVNSSMEVIPGFINNAEGINSTNGMMLVGNTGVIDNSPMIMIGGASSNIHLDSVSGLKHDTGLAGGWSLDEMAILKAGLITYASEPNIMKYIKIAANLQDKTVRDVALRCQWMAKENGRQRMIGHSAGKKIKDSKEKMVGPSLMTSIHPLRTDNMSAYSFMMHQTNQSNHILCEVPVIDGLTQQLMEENARIFGQITANIAILKIHENVDLFFQMRNNITATLNSMSQSPGIMSQMPPLPISVNEDLLNTILACSNQIHENVDLFFQMRNNITATLNSMSQSPGIMSQIPPLPISVNEDLLNTILSCSNQALVFGITGGVHLKQEQRC